MPATHTLTASDEMTLQENSGELCLYLNKTFTVLAVSVNGKEVAFRFDVDAVLGDKPLHDDNAAADFRRAGLLHISRPLQARTVTVTYSGALNEEPTLSQFSRETIVDQTAGLITDSGSFLSPASFWYPRGAEKMSRFSLETITPPGYESMSDGEQRLHRVREKKLRTRWENPHPVDGLYLQAGPYEIGQGEVAGIRVYTYFFSGGAELAALYLQKSRQYLSFYNRLLGRYPYAKFAVVENFFETGYGMPSWTLLGRTVVRLPFIPDTSLPHEICHNWWGNGVFVDYSLGNWCEGLTSLCADYLLRTQRGPEGGAEYRRQVLRDYASHVRKSNDFPLAAFRVRDNPASRAVGYGKALMVFHELQRRLGEANFFAALRRLFGQWRFRQATWKDVLAVFASQGHFASEAFFRQWIQRPGAPVITLEDVRLDEAEGQYEVSFILRQVEDVYDLAVPLTITVAGEPITREVNLTTERKEYKLDFNERPQRLEIDPQHHLFRRLFPQEVPPAIAKVLGAETVLLLWQRQSAGEDGERFRAAAELLGRNRSAQVLAADQTIVAESRNQTFVYIGDGMLPPAWAAFLRPVWREPPAFPAPSPLDDQIHCAVMALDHPENRELAVLVLNVGKDADLATVIRKLPHYGKYGYLVFDNGTNRAKGEWEAAASPLQREFGPASGNMR